MTKTPLAFAAIMASLAIPANAGSAPFSVQPQASSQRAEASADRLEAFTPRVRGTSTMAGPASVAGIVRDMVRFRLGRLGAPAPRRR